MANQQISDQDLKFIYLSSGVFNKYRNSSSPSSSPNIIIPTIISDIIPIIH